MKKCAKFWVAVSLLLCLVSSVGAAVFQTNFGKVEYHDMTFVTESGHEMDALLLVPKTATKENPMVQRSGSVAGMNKIRQPRNRTEKTSAIAVGIIRANA